MAEPVVLTQEQLDQLRQFAPDHLKVVQSMMRQERRAKRDTAKAMPVEPSDTPELVIDFTNLEERLTLADLEEMERASGVPAISAMTMLGSSAMGLAALIWVLRRRDDPAYTYEQARAISAGALVKMLSSAKADKAADESPLDSSDAPSA